MESSGSHPALPSSSDFSDYKPFLFSVRHFLKDYKTNYSLIEIISWVVFLMKSVWHNVNEEWFFFNIVHHWFPDSYSAWNNYSFQHTLLLHWQKLSPLPGTWETFFRSFLVVFLSRQSSLDFDVAVVSSHILLSWITQPFLAMTLRNTLGIHQVHNFW